MQDKKFQSIFSTCFAISVRGARMLRRFSLGGHARSGFLLGLQRGSCGRMLCSARFLLGCCGTGPQFRFRSRVTKAGHGSGPAPMAAGPCPNHVGGLGYTQATSRRNLEAAEIVPAPQLAERDPKPVGDRYQRIPPARGVEHSMRRGNRRRDGHHQRFNSGQARAFTQLVGRRQLRYRHAIRP